jgi:hypothetical protein
MLRTFDAQQNSRKKDCQMHMVKLLAALGALMFSSLAFAQTAFECGSVACVGVTPWDTTDITGINDLNVHGHLFDVSFTTTAPASSPFVLSQTAAAPGQPLTGIDAGNAIANFYAAQLPPYANGYDIGGDQGPAFITAFGPAGALSGEFFGSTELFDAVQTVVGGDGTGNVALVAPGGYSFNERQVVNAQYGFDYTVWKPIAAPEIDPTSAASGLTLLLGGLAVLRGRGLYLPRSVRPTTPASKGAVTSV